MGVLEIHIWGSHRDRIEQPDYVVFDFDPDEGLDWERVVEGALAMRAFLDDLGLRTFLKTTGGKGLHVVLPIARKDDWDEVKAFTKAVAEKMVAAEPGEVHLEAPEGQPQGEDLHRLPPQRPRRHLDLRLLHPRPGERPGLRPALLGGAGDRRARQHLHPAHRSPSGWRSCRPTPGRTSSRSASRSRRR